MGRYVDDYRAEDMPYLSNKLGPRRIQNKILHNSGGTSSLLAAIMSATAPVIDLRKASGI